MLDEGEGLEGEEGQASLLIEGDTKGVGGELSLDAGAEAREALRAVALDDGSRLLAARSGLYYGVPTETVKVQAGTLS